MELCTQCNRPESAHTLRIFGHKFKPPTEESNPGYAGDLVDSLSGLGDAFTDSSSDGGAGGGGCSDAGDGGCSDGGDGGGGGGGE